MRQVALVGLLVLAVIGCAAPMAKESPELAARSDAWEAALNAGDLETLVALYAADARLMPPNAPMAQGQDAVREAFGEMIEAGLGGQLETVEAFVVGDLGYHTGSYTIQAPDGEVVDRGKFQEIWRLTDGEWLIASDIWNSDLPVAEPAGLTMVGIHEVEDAARWLAAWQGEDSRRELFAAHGAPSVRVLQSVEDPNLTGLIIEVTDMEALQAMLDSPEGEAAKAEDGVKSETLRMFREVE